MIVSVNEIILNYLKDEGAEKVGLFGSYSSGNFTSSSDIDVLVRFKSPKGLFALSRIQRELSENTGYHIDLVTEKSVSPYLARVVEESLVVLYEEK